MKIMNLLKIINFLIKILYYYFDNVFNSEVFKNK